MTRTSTPSNIDLDIGELSLGGLDPHRRRALDQHIRTAIEAGLASHTGSLRGGVSLEDLDVRVRHDDDGPAIGRCVAEALFSAMNRERETRP